MSFESSLGASGCGSLMPSEDGSLRTGRCSGAGPFAYMICSIVTLLPGLRGSSTAISRAWGPSIE